MMALETMDSDLKQIHEASMIILEQTGMRFNHPEVVNILRENGVKVEGSTAFFTRIQLMEWVSKAPSQFKMYARNSKYDFEVGGDHVELLPGYGSPFVCSADGKKRDALMSDYVKFLKLFHQSEHHKANGGVVVQPNDIAKSQIVAMLYTAIVHSDKVLVAGSGSAEDTEKLMELLAIVFGGKEALVEKPRCLTIVNTNSPLQLDTNMLDTMMVFNKYKQPIVIAACAMAGTTAPVTLAATIAITNAEVLAGIAVAQMINPGTPVIYGSQSTTSDMKTGSIACGSPEGALCYQYAARLAKAYGLPCRGGGAISDAKALSVQAGYESMLTFLATYTAKTNVIIHSAGIMDSYNAMSYEKFIVDLEIIGMVKRYVAGLAVNEETLALDVIQEVGVAGEFLSSVHTMQHCRKEPFLPDISLRGSVAGDPGESLLNNVQKKEHKMLESYCKPEMPADIKDKLTEYVLGCGFNEQLIRELQA
ncbi:trimethylamine--corrinoid protein Co-methyltransferase [Desulfitobacterium sp. LBE]|uniref:Methyltransferase n=1 Tax=Desulfitobacterium hafniense DP7 TaxID=537010 RepID=G9XIT7_DESHA|nr:MULTISPECIES: trimethylamine methyltransferase family protein [Desulfitobacterium]EHL08551.1 trimethylamine methyltransferase [Desulfitobacterium hafniense DP7]TWH57380.1 trimethylamine--corrinoid protein Co-methyltransferase [Desulfitobacterium sp. LBE]